MHSASSLHIHVTLIPMTEMMDVSADGFSGFGLMINKWLQPDMFAARDLNFSLLFVSTGTCGVT